MGDIRETLDRSEQMLCKGINEIHERGDLNASNLELLAEAWDTVKDIYSIREKMQDNGSYERYPYYGARERDSRGRYMNDGYTEKGYRNESYGNDERDFIKQKMQNATSEHERDMYRKMLDRM